MKKHEVLFLTVALVLSSQIVQATTITGITGSSGTYNINPAQAAKSIGYRTYKDFDLSKNDIANLVMQYEGKDLSYFVNLVDNKVNIDGILNTTRGNSFAKGQAIFIAPNGFTVGSNGVINVGSLSVVSPTASHYNSLVSDPTTLKINDIKNDRNADITINGTVLTRSTVNLYGKNISFGENGRIDNGVKDDVIATNSNYTELINNHQALGQNIKNANTISTNNGYVILSAANSVNIDANQGGIFNTENGVIQIVSNGEGGTIIKSGNISNVGGGNTQILSNKDGLNIDGSVLTQGGNLTIINKDKALTFGSNGQLEVKNGSLKALNEGSEGFSSDAKITTDGPISFLKNTNGDMHIGGNLDLNPNSYNQIVNTATTNSKMTLDADINTQGKYLYIYNTGSNGLDVNGTIKNDNPTLIVNKNGNLSLGANIDTKGLQVKNYGKDLNVTENSDIKSNGNVVFSNVGSGTETIGGNIDTNGITSITNTGAGTVINGTIKDKDGYIVVNNKAGGLTLTENAKLTTYGTGTNIALQNSGDGGVSINGVLDSNKNMTVVNTKGSAKVNGDISAKNNVIVSNKSTTGEALSVGADLSGDNVTISNSAKQGMKYAGNIDANTKAYVYNTNGNVNITGDIASDNKLYVYNTASNGGTTINSKADLTGKTVVINNKGSNGLTINGKVSSSSDMSIANQKGNFEIGGTLNGNGGKVKVYNKENSGNMKLTKKSVVTNKNGQTYIVNQSTKGMNLQGTIKPNGKTVIYNEAGYVTISSDINKNSTVSLYSRKNSKGVKVN